MTIYAKNITPAQRAWLENYELVTEYEPMHQEELDAGEMTFHEVAQANLTWYEWHTKDAYLRASAFQEGLTDADKGFDLI